MKTRQLSKREHLIHLVQNGTGRIITVAGVIAKNKNSRGMFNLRMGVAIKSPEDEFASHVGHDKAIGRAVRKDMKIMVANEAMVENVLLGIGKRIEERVLTGQRPYVQIENYNLPAKAVFK